MATNLLARLTSRSWRLAASQLQQFQADGVLVNQASEILRKHGATKIALCALQSSHDRVYRPEDIADDIDGIVIIDEMNFRSIMRMVEPLARRNCLIVPASPDWVVAKDLRENNAMDAAWRTTPAANYIARCNLRGHYLEFGTFWGGSFFPNYFRFRRWLDGRFFAFDSFCGLSAPEPDETRFTAGDFHAGAYCANERSFLALADLLGVSADRVSIVSGFYDRTLAGIDPQIYHLEPRSVSVCYIDCDLKAPTTHVLDFVTTLLEPGALLYFDDWRLCRASPHVGERAAALDWLARNMDVELIEFDRNAWQHQWFIFQRR